MFIGTEWLNNGRMVFSPIAPLLIPHYHFEKELPVVISTSQHYSYFFFFALPRFRLGLLESCNSIKYFIWVNHMVISFNFYILVVLLKYTNFHTLLHVLPNTFCIGMSQKNIHYLNYFFHFIMQWPWLEKLKPNWKKWKKKFSGSSVSNFLFWFPSTV